MELTIGPTEFELMKFFMTHPDRALSRGQWVHGVCSDGVSVEARTVDVHVRRLRSALQAKDRRYSDLIQTVHGTGYRFSPGILEER